VGRPIQVLPVVLDAERVLADEVVGKLGEDLFGGFEEAPGADLAEADETVVGMDLDEEVPIDGHGLDASDAHDVCKGTSGGGRERTATR
jgi:hypothetical protein